MVLRSEFEYCMGKGMLRKVIASGVKAKKSLLKSGKWLKSAKINIESGTFDSCLISSYLCMFHAARAILIRDGIREKSHYCLARYLEEKYVRTKKIDERWINLLDHFRELRHSDQYDVNFLTSEADARSSIEFAEKFLKRMERLFSEDEKRNHPGQ